MLHYFKSLQSNTKQFQNVFYFECFKDYSQAEQLQTKMSGQYAQNILLNISKSLFNIYLFMYFKRYIHVGKHNINRVNLLMQSWVRECKDVVKVFQLLDSRHQILVA